MTRVALACLDGGPSPEGLAADVALLRLVEGAARAELVDALAHVLHEPISAAADAALEALAQKRSLDTDLLGRVVRAVRFVLREAARRGLPEQALGADIDALTGGDPETRAIFVGGYGDALQIVRKEVLIDTIADHGNVLTGVEWRVDTIGRSSRGPSVEGSIAWLTLRYQREGQERSVSLQVVPGVLEELRRAVEAMKR